MKEIDSLIVALQPWQSWNAFVLLIGGCITWWFYRRDNKQFKATKFHSRQLLNSIPTIWTSLGIFGTFCAICISLNAFAAVEDETVKDMSLITRLIGNLVPAFSTSIYGIVGAVITTIINKLRYQAEEVAEFEQLDSPEKNIKSIVTLLKSQQELSRIYNEELTTNILSQSDILKRFVDDFVDRMDVIFKKMETSIEQQVQTFGNSQFEQSRKVLEEMTQKMSEVSSGLIEQQKENIKASIDTTQKQLDEISTSLTSMIDNVSATSSSAIQALTDQQNEKLSLLVQNQEVLSNKLFEESARSNEQLQKNMQELGEQYAASCEEMLNKATEQNEQVAKQLNDSLSDVVSQISESVSAECKGLADAISNIVDQLGDSYEFIDEHIAQIKSDYEQATLAYRDAVQNAHDNNEVVESAITRMNESLSAMENTNKNIKNILSLLETRQTNIDNLTQRIREVSEAIVSLQNLEATLNKLRA